MKREIEISSNYYDDTYFTIIRVKCFEIHYGNHIKFANIKFKNLPSNGDKANEIAKKYMKIIIEDSPNLYEMEAKYNQNTHIMEINYRTIDDKDLDFCMINYALNNNSFKTTHDVIPFLTESHINDNIDEISLYQVVRLINDTRKKYYNSLNNFIDLCNKRIEKNEENEKIKHIEYISKYHFKIILINDTELHLYNNHNDWKFDDSSLEQYFYLLGKINNLLPMFLKHHQEFEHITKETNSVRIKSSNLPFSPLIHPITSNYILKLDTVIDGKPERLFSMFDFNKYSYSIDSGIILSNTIDNEENILKNIQVNIKDCPSWMQPYLTKMREDELAKPKNDIKQLTKEMKETNE